MPLKSKIKSFILGPPGERLRVVRGGVLKGYQFPIDTSDSSMKLVGLWETEIAAAVRRLVAHADVACDIGSNTGWYTLFFASCPGIRRVFGFEPDTSLVECARRNLMANDPSFIDRVTLVNKLVGNRSDEQWCRLDDVLADIEGSLAFKIDVDGGEYDVLSGARQTLASRPCRLVIETHSIELEKQCIAFLTELGYQTRVIKNAWYRVIIPETRNIPHNRWMEAWK